MIFRIITSVSIIVTVHCLYNVDTLSSNKTFIYNTYNYDTRIKLVVNNTTEQILDFYENSSLTLYPTRVHVSTKSSISIDYPLFITAAQQKGVSSWELPLVVQTRRWPLLFSSMARTLCPHDSGPDISSENSPTIHLTTSNPNDISVDIKLRRVTDFLVEVNKEVVANVTPSTPKYYYFSFDQTPWNVTTGPLRGLNYTIPKSVILMIEADNDLCATVSIQNNSCPVFDNEKEMLYQGYHLTMMSKGGITLTQSMFPSGFYIVFIVKESDDDCVSEDSPAGLQSEPWIKTRMKSFRFRVIATISYKEYVIGALVTVALLCVVVLVALVALLPCRLTCTEEVLIIEEESIIPQASTSWDSAAREPLTESSGAVADNDSDEEDEDLVANRALSHGSSSKEYINEPLVGSSGAGAGPADDVQVRVLPLLTVHNLTRAPPDTFARRSDRYFWGALTLAIVYALPVVQLLFTYQGMVFQTGDQDLCYYNFLCAHPLGFLSDFNHVFSNIGYVFLGLVFMIHVRVRQLRAKHRPQDMGIPQHYGLLYSMGLGLVMEGVLSACYHLCPNKMNFQFDSSFMYVIAVLVMIKLYQNRHSDIIPSAHTTFLVLAFIMTIGLLGILYHSVYFSVLFTVLHLYTCSVLTLKIYYANDFKLELAMLRRGWRNLRSVGLGALVPAHRARAILLGLANLANWSFAIYSAHSHNKDFARPLLAILMGNAILYTLFYMCMKLVHRERVLAHTWLYCALAHAAWFTALWLFTSGHTKWSETPAQSRKRNAECSSLQMFDNHDLWHVASAAALFLSFHMLLTLDDALVDTPRHALPTF